MLANAFQALQTGDFARSEAIGRQLLTRSPDDEGTLLVLALCLEAQHRNDEALPFFQRLTMLNPGASAHWSNLGNIQRQMGRRDEARGSFLRALQIDPAESTTLFNLGLLESDDGHFHIAHGYLGRAAMAQPDDAGIRSTHANAAFLAGDSDQAEAILDGWQQWAGDDPLAIADTGWTFIRMGIADQADLALQRANAMLPRHPKVQVRLAAYLERSNRLDEARTTLAGIDESAAQAEGMGDDLRIVRAQLAARDDDVASALAQHQVIVSDPVAARRYPELLSAIARMHDRRGDPELAMQWADRAHAVQLDELRTHAPHWLEPGADPLGITRHRIDAVERSRWPDRASVDAANSPLFVVGFPRSGTTMLETMLDAHPQLVGMDERSFLQNLVESIRQRGLRYPEDLGLLDDATCDSLRETYWGLVRHRVRLEPGQRLVDKNPLNILRLPLINRLFPQAKIILALRHPCDVVLSNYLQTFRNPAYVALCGTLATTAQGYADTFDFWIDQAAVLRPDALELRYEDVVDDIDGQSRRIAAFAGIEWDRRMVDFHDRAKARGYIATPSYHQVVEPINRKGVDRWQRYRAHLEPVLPTLQPYLDRWVYAS